jgi:hypothetical protein
MRHVPRRLMLQMWHTIAGVVDQAEDSSALCRTSICLVLPADPDQVGLAVVPVVEASLVAVAGAYVGSYWGLTTTALFSFS